MRSVASGGPGLVAVGSTSSGGDSDAAVWTSPDGITWSRVPHDEAVFGGEREQAMSSVTAWGPGLVAVGSGGDSHVAVWMSPDGVTWSRVPHDEAVLGGERGRLRWSVTAGGPGLVAVGSAGLLDDLDAAVWVAAPDGTISTFGSTFGPDDLGVAQHGDLVSVHYVGTLDSGEQFDSSRDRGQTLSFTIGAGQMILGFDAAVIGMAIGNVTSVRIAPDEAYGEHNAELISDVRFATLPEGTQVGQTLLTGSGAQVVVVAIEGDAATIDGNHPLAGLFLTFEIEMVSIER